MPPAPKWNYVCLIGEKDLTPGNLGSPEKSHLTLRYTGILMDGFNPSSFINSAGSMQTIDSPRRFTSDSNQCQGIEQTVGKATLLFTFWNICFCIKPLEVRGIHCGGMLRIALKEGKGSQMRKRTKHFGILNPSPTYIWGNYSLAWGPCTTVPYCSLSSFQVTRSFKCMGPFWKQGLAVLGLSSACLKRNGENPVLK